MAAGRLRQQGLEGLSITGVAEEAGISHATLLHHFGSSDGMRAALADKMTLDLVTDLVAAFDANVSTTEMTRNLFAALEEGGHARLIAWRAVEELGDHSPMGELTQGFGQLLAKAQEALGVEQTADIKRIVMLVAVAATGFGLAGRVLADVLDMSEEDLQDFPRWLTEHIS